MSLKYIFYSVIFTALACSCSDEKLDDSVICHNDIFTVTGDSVVQGNFVAYAPSATEIVTNYVSPADKDFPNVVEFRLSFNSRDNEMFPGHSHYAVIGVDTMVNVGEAQMMPQDVKAAKVANNTKWKIKVNMAPMVRSFKNKGVYVTPTGDSIFQADFKGVWIAGNAAPMTWDFDNLYGRDDLKLLPEPGSDSIYSVTLSLNPKVNIDKVAKSWKIEKPNEDFPTYSSNQVLVDALYNMAIDNIVADIRPDNTYRAGSGWDGVWTRDVSYSAYLALAYLDPVRTMKSLKAKVKNERIVQDTGTGGSWPISSDREVWAVAAWEVYNVTGDKNWLEYAYNVISNSIADDRKVLVDKVTGLMHGEQSFLDWREQSYPKWMQPKDIFESLCLGTNVVFSRTYSILADMGEELGEENGYGELASRLKDDINHALWNEENGYYSEYMYGGVYPMRSPGIDNLGQALSVIWDIADDDRAETLMAKTPITDFGTPAIYPRIPNIKPYHNDAVWPFVQAFWNLAAAKTENENSLRRGLGALYRAAALFGTHKELFVASTGDYNGSAVNSNNQLWSAAGNVAMIFRVYAGMEFFPNGIRFQPVVPGCLPGTKVIRNFKYRKAELDITINGTGRDIASMTMDGNPMSDAFLAANIEGKHSIVINLENKERSAGYVTMAKMEDMPANPSVEWKRDTAKILNFAKNNKYISYVNGKKNMVLSDSLFYMDIAGAKQFTKIYVQAVCNKLYSFIGKPYYVIPSDAVQVVQVENFAEPGTELVDYNRALGFVETSTTKNTDLKFHVNVKQGGVYFLDVRYSNGSGPINTDNCCAIRSVFVNTHEAGAIVMPQRGKNEWYSTGYSNMLMIELLTGDNVIQLKYQEPENVNMNELSNRALIDYIRVIKK